MKIAIIDVNDVTINESDMIHDNFTFDKIEDTVTEFVVLKEANNENEMMQIIVDQVLELVNGSNDYPIHTATVKNYKNDLYLLCHINPSKEIYEEFKKNKIPYNGIASYLTDLGLKIYSKAVLFKLDLTTNKLLTITMDEICQLFISKFVHKGIIIDKNGSLNEFKYIFNPVDWIHQNEISKYKFHETEILDKVLMMFFDTTDTEPNQLASLICQNSLTGHVIIGFRSLYGYENAQEVVYDDLDIDTFKQIIKLCKDSNQSRKLRDDENTIGNVVDGRMTYNNFHKILETRLNESLSKKVLV